MPQDPQPSADFIAEFLAYTEGTSSPDIFRQWSAISMLAGALERRVWIKTGRGLAFPNLYTLLVAPPGVGKFIIETVRELWTASCQPGTKIPAYRVAPDSMTKASLMDTLVKAKNIFLAPSGPPLISHSLLVAAEEFSVLMPTYDMEYIGSLNSIWCNKDLHEESRRTGSVRELKIEFPCLNILGGVQPSFLASTFPEEAWASGLARRLIMVYSSEAPYKELFYENTESAEIRGRLLARLTKLSTAYGQLGWTREAAEAIADWDRVGGPPVPQHSKLAHYNRSRTQLVLKLIIISVLARTPKLLIELVDVRRAIAWLVDAERLMPDIFREMIGKSDSQLLEELHLYAHSTYIKSGKKPIYGQSLWRFLGERAPSEKIERLIMVAERSNMIARVAGADDMWIPRPKHTHGAE